MKKIMGNTLLKFIAALLCVVLLLGAAWYGIWSVLVTVAPAETIARNTLQMAMAENTRAVLWYEGELERVLESKEPDWSDTEDYIRELFDPALTNFRFKVLREGEFVLSTYNDEPQVADYTYYWDEEFIGTDIDINRINAYESGRVYDYVNDEWLPDRGNYRYAVESYHGLPKEYVTYDENGYLYDAEDNLVAFVENYAETLGQSYVSDVPFEVDGTIYYPIDPAEGYPTEFAYYNDYGKVFDSNLDFIGYLDEYHSDGSGIVGVSPTPRAVTDTAPILTPAPTPTPKVQSDSAVKPIIRELDLLTHEEYNTMREELYVQTWVIGYIVQSAEAFADANAIDGVETVDAESEAVLEPTFAVEDQYSRLYDYMISMCAENSKPMDQIIGLFAVALLLLIFLMMAAGHRSTAEGDQIVLRAVDRMPWDLWLCFVAAGAALAFGGVYLGADILEPAARESIAMVDLVLKFWIVVAALTLAFVVWMLMSFAARVKVKGWWRNCLCGKVLAVCWKWCVKLVKWCWRLWLRIWHGCKSLVGGIPMIWKAVLVLAVLWIVETVYVAANVWSGWAVIGILWNIVKFLLCVIICLMFKRLQQGARTIADGDLNYRIDTKNLFGEFKKHAECLNRIGDGLSHSVDAQLRSERMKTELITNVSHDLKTPLTSIVNYVDLLKKEELEGTVGEYVEVLDRQSARLKKLTEDLVEASKASTGSLNVTVERVSVTELIEQARAEYALRLGENGLQTIIRQPNEEVIVWADGKYVWRILDNLLSNVCKYAMPNTRVYLELRKEGENAVMSVKNMSRESLNISAEELMERFVRGDSSRTTEGSGLGLSIAQSLAKLMGGEVRVTIDGDLFKADVMLPLAK